MWFFLILTTFTTLSALRVIHRPIMNEIPCLRLHPLILLNVTEEYQFGVFKSQKATYLIDYLPEERLGFFSLIKIICGFGCKGRVRIVRLPYIVSDVKEDLSVIHNVLDTYKKRRKFFTPYLMNPSIHKILHSFPSEYHLYSNNCRHFAKYILSELRTYNF
jgi:hypothetical protein